MIFKCKYFELIIIIYHYIFFTQLPYEFLGKARQELNYFKTTDSKKEEFRKYLEKSGVID